MSAVVQTPPAPRVQVVRWSRTASASVAGFAVLVAVAAAVPMLFVPLVGNRLTALLALVVLAVTWNALAGYAGLVSVGQQGFFGLGAYAVLALSDLGVNAYLSVPLAGVVCALVALPSSLLLFRLRAGQFAIGTWVLAEVFRLLVSRVPQLGAGTGRSLTSTTGVDPALRQALTYWTALAMTVLVLVGAFALLRSRVGIRLQAVRDDENAARSLGVGVTGEKRLVFVLGSGGAGVAGAITLTNSLTAQPDNMFGVQWAALMIFMVVIGGIGAFEGPIIGAVLLFVVQQLFDGLGNWYLVGLGVLAVVATLSAPRGVWGELAHRRGWTAAPLFHDVRWPALPLASGAAARHDAADTTVREEGRR
ncbi:branched-chain amino acid ABC transporter permease [Kineosporia sp. R_H_3]|uniref:branched-chain amino acid ABC transporter permease n=1 Tax=Kineosporia sp. R_H_3 TaxID=1961848 RepID=UPI000B4C03FB|nr:branched-chain amino acid ABC transporter permease [Kineosporia sp. R_H_3]